MKWNMRGDIQPMSLGSPTRGWMTKPYTPWASKSAICRRSSSSFRSSFQNQNGITENSRGGSRNSAGTSAGLLAEAGERSSVADTRIAVQRQQRRQSVEIDRRKQAAFMAEFSVGAI